jgi:hypothetical protein
MAGTSPAMTLQAARTALLTFRPQPATRRAFAAGNIAVSNEAEQRSIELDRNATTCIDLLCAEGAG